MILKGKVSRVEQDSKGEPRWVRIYFEDAPDLRVSACSPNPEIFGRFGVRFRGLIGRTIEVAGLIDDMCTPAWWNPHPRKRPNQGVPQPMTPPGETVMVRELATARLQHRTTRFRRPLGVGLLVAFAVLPFPIHAISLKDFNAKPDKDQAAYVSAVVERIAGNMNKKNTRLAQEIRGWFSQKADGETMSDGMERLYLELAALDAQAKEGRADLSKIEFESVVTDLLKRKFPTYAWWVSFQQ